ncbi:unnamed protein product [Ectocarpus sp. 12 AP-2014]
MPPHPAVVQARTAVAVTVLAVSTRLPRSSSKHHPQTFQQLPLVLGSLAVGAPAVIGVGGNLIFPCEPRVRAGTRSACRARAGLSGACSSSFRNSVLLSQ